MAIWQAWKNRFCTALFVGVVSTQAAYAVPVLSITTAPAVQGSPVSLDVLISGIADLSAYQFTLSFNAAVLQAVGATEGPFLATGGTTFSDGGTIDNTAGTIAYIFNTLIGPVAGVSGSGVLAHINFNVVGAGTSALTFSDVLFLDSTSSDLTLQVNNNVLQATAVPEPASLVLLGAGLAGLAAWRRRQTI